MRSGTGWVRRSAAGLTSLLLASTISGCADTRRELAPPPEWPVLPHIVSGPPTLLPDPTGSRDLVTTFITPLDFRPRWSAGDEKTPAAQDSFELTTRPVVRRLGVTANRLARALHLPGRASTTDGHRRYGDGVDQALVIDLEPGLQWAYTRDGVRCADVSPSEADTLSDCAPLGVAREPGDWDPHRRRWTQVSPKRALELAAPVFRALRLDIDAARTTTGWGTTLVSVDPTIEGLPTVGLGTGVVVDGKGVLSAAGWLGAASRVARYPVVDASVAIAAADRLTGEDCPTAGSGRGPHCLPEVRLTPAELGLARWTAAASHAAGRPDRPLMVPVWIGRNLDRYAIGTLPALDRSYLPVWMAPPVALQ